MTFLPFIAYQIGELFLLDGRLLEISPLRVGWEAFLPTNRDFTSGKRVATCPMPVPICKIPATDGTLRSLVATTRCPKRLKCTSRFDAH